MKIYLTILLTILFVFACDSSDPSNNETKCTSDTDCTDPTSSSCNSDGICVAKTTILFINEIMASNDSYLDGSDWVEIYNPNDLDIDLAGFYLCDNHYSDEGLDSCTLVADSDSAKTTVKAKGFLVFTFNKDLTDTLNITQNLGSSGDSVYLISPNKDIIDTYKYDDTSGLDTDISIGRSTDGGDTWILFTKGEEKQPTPNESNEQINNTPVCTIIDETKCIAPKVKCLVDTNDAMNNTCVECLAGIDCSSDICNADNTCEASPPEIKLFINEIMASNKSYTQFVDSDWVEIYNDSDIAIDLAGYYLCDGNYDTDGISKCTKVPDTDSATTTVAAKGFIVFYFNKDDLGGVLNIAQKLGGSADTVTLLDSTETLVDSKYYIVSDGLSTDDSSLGLSVDGGDTWEKFIKGTAKEPTPGATNIQ